MNNSGSIECDTVQILEPEGDFLVDTAGSTSDLDERGVVVLSDAQTRVDVVFQVPKLNTSYSFEYLYVDALGNIQPGGIHVIPVTRSAQGFTVVLAGAPIGLGYVLHWRVTIVRASSLVQIDAPEDLYLQMPRATSMEITFVNPRSGVNYGFSELRVENLADLIGGQTIVHVQVFQKTLTGFSVGISPRPPSDNYFLKVRTP